MKNLLSCIAFCLIAVLLLLPFNSILAAKHESRYYMMEEELKTLGPCDVQIYGSCHSYTSFNAKSFEDSTNISAYVMAAAGEIIPATYLRMNERFKTNTPKVALLDIWGLNAYETYIKSEDNFEFYLPAIVTIFPFSKEKNEIIARYDSLDFFNENIPLVRYKERILSSNIVEADFNYEFKEEFSEEMTTRFANNGYLVYTDIGKTEDYIEQQAVIELDDKLEIESDLMFYFEKIVDLCEEYDVELILYRAPYRSCENELRKLNWFTDYCNENNLTFVDLEQAIEFDYTTDFRDYEHLNINGAQKATDFLTPYILEAMNN